LEVNEELAFQQELNKKFQVRCCLSIWSFGSTRLKGGIWQHQTCDHFNDVLMFTSKGGNVQDWEMLCWKNNLLTFPKLMSTCVII
jgi:hypothetical protein